jgi:hypothetical protein
LAELDPLPGHQGHQQGRLVLDGIFRLFCKTSWILRTEISLKSASSCFTSHAVLNGNFEIKLLSLFIFLMSSFLWRPGRLTGSGSASSGSDFRDWSIL